MSEGLNLNKSSTNDVYEFNCSPELNEVVSPVLHSTTILQKSTQSTSQNSEINIQSTTSSSTTFVNSYSNTSQKPINGKLFKNLK